MGNIITPYNGPINNIPKGWYLCNGGNNTPNLEDRFIKGGDWDSIDIMGGNLGEHTHAVTSSGGHSHSDISSSGSHRHEKDTDASPYFRTNDGDYGITYVTHDHPSTSSSDSHTHAVNGAIATISYYTLCYIMAEDDTQIHFPIGSIVMYRGLESDLLPGWALCNGQNGTLNLVDKFIKGGATKGGEGGANTHVHTTNTAGSHTHSITSKSFPHSHTTGDSVGGYGLNPYAMSGMTTDGPSHSHSAGSAGSHSHSLEGASNDPPYYKLAFIQRIF